jgi:hypothetical protein
MKPNNNRIKIGEMKKFLWPICLFIFCILVYYISSPGNTPYDYFTRLSVAFLQGKYWLSQSPPWLSELIPAGLGRYYVAYPPFPAILALPFVAIFGSNFPQQYLAHALGAGIVVLTFKISLSVKNSLKLAVWSAILVGIGSIIWYLSSVGSSWYLGQVAAAFFLTAAIAESLEKKRGFIVGIFLGAAYLSRLQSILSLPFFLYQLYSPKWKKNYLKVVLGILPFFIFNSLYNFARFGTILDKGYFLIPGLLQEPWFNKGLFSLTYIPNHLKIIFLSFPIFSRTFPYIKPSWAGLSIWITTPAFIYSLWANIKKRIIQMSWFSIGAIALVVFSHGSTGFAQFGYRFAVDFYPLLVLLTILGVSKQNGPKWHHWLLLALGIIVNLWGVLWINKFGWVSF